jgi:uncharacterized membrane protein
VYDALQRMRAGPLLGLEHSAIVTSDSQGRLAVTQRWELASARKDPHSDLAGSAAALLFSNPPDEKVQALANKGFDDRFRQQMLQALPDNYSALLILMPRDGRVDRGRLLGTLTLFKGQLFETTLPQAVETVLAKS